MRKRREKLERMGKVVEKKTKKKGRPSLLDLQKRRIQEQNENEQRDNSVLKPRQNHNHAIPTPPRRSSRRNPAADSSSPEDTSIKDEDDEKISSGRGRREKKLKLVVKLLNSSSGDQGGSDSEGEEEDATQNQKKRKIAAIGDRSGFAEIEKVSCSSLGQFRNKRVFFSTQIKNPSAPFLLFLACPRLIFQINCEFVVSLYFRENIR